MKKSCYAVFHKFISHWEWIFQAKSFIWIYILNIYLLIINNLNVYFYTFWRIHDDTKNIFLFQVFVIRCREILQQYMRDSRIYSSSRKRCQKPWALKNSATFYGKVTQRRVLLIHLWCIDCPSEMPRGSHKWLCMVFKNPALNNPHCWLVTELPYGVWTGEQTGYYRLTLPCHRQFLAAHWWFNTAVAVITS